MSVYAVRVHSCVHEHIADHALYPLLYVAGYTGLRRRELCGLRWEDADLAAGRLGRQAQSLGNQITSRN